jgi:hypothetical protein
MRHTYAARGLCALLCLVSTPLASANSGYLSSCLVAFDGANYRLSGHCTSASGSSVDATLDLNKCLTNNNGDLVAQA